MIRIGIYLNDLLSNKLSNSFLDEPIVDISYSKIFVIHCYYPQQISKHHTLEHNCSTLVYIELGLLCPRSKHSTHYFTFIVTPPFLTVFTFNPTVGTVNEASPKLNQFRTVVLPAFSRPTIQTSIEELLKKLLSFSKKFPI